MNLYSSPQVREDALEVASSLSQVVKSELAGSRVLITGANGLIGGALCCALLSMNDEEGLGIEVVAAVRNAETAARRFGDISSRADFQLLQYDVLAPLPDVGSVDLLIHGASQTSPAHFNDDPVGTLRANVLGTDHLLQFLTDQGRGRFVLLSTREVYGYHNNGPRFLTESDYGVVDPTDPRSCYPEGKRAAEALVAAYHTQHEVDGIVARVSHTYGPGMKLLDGRVIGDFLGGALRNREIRMLSDGTAELALTYIADCVAGILTASAIPAEPLYNVSSEEDVCTVGQLADAIAELSGSQIVKVAPANGNSRGYLTRRPAFLDSTRLRALGWVPNVRLREGVERTLSYFKYGPASGSAS